MNTLSQTVRTYLGNQILRWQLRRTLAIMMIVTFVMAAAIVNLLWKPTLSQQSGFVIEHLAQQSSRAVVHALYFAAIGGLLGRWPDGFGSTTMAMRYVISGGIAVEVVQVLTAHSSLNWLTPLDAMIDMIVNIVGAGVGLSVLAAINRRWHS